LGWQRASVEVRVGQLAGRKKGRTAQVWNRIELEHSPLILQHPATGSLQGQPKVDTRYTI